MVDWSSVEHFGPDEFTEPDEMDPDFVATLDRVRAFAGVPIHITSSFRRGDPKSHGRGLAVDIADNRTGVELTSRWRYRVLAAAFRAGIRRVGIYDRHIHLDIDPSLPQDVAWWSESS